MEADYAAISEFVETNLDRFAKVISEGDHARLRHFWRHGEYEMALEGLVLELIGLDIQLSEAEYEVGLELVRSMGMDEHQSFDRKFWPKMLRGADQVAAGTIAEVQTNERGARVPAEGSGVPGADSGGPSKKEALSQPDIPRRGSHADRNFTPRSSYPACRASSSCQNSAADSRLRSLAGHGATSKTATD